MARGSPEESSGFRLETDLTTIWSYKIAEILMFRTFEKANSFAKEDLTFFSRYPKSNHTQKLVSILHHDYCQLSIVNCQSHTRTATIIIDPGWFNFSPTNAKSFILQHPETTIAFEESRANDTVCSFHAAPVLSGILATVGTSLIQQRQRRRRQ